MNGKEADIRTTPLQGQQKKECPLSENAERDPCEHCSSISDTTKSSSRSNPFPLTAAQSEFEVNMENNTLTEINGRGVRFSFVSRSTHISGNIDAEYQEAATEYQIRWIAKRIAIRDSALLTLASLCIYLVFGVLFYSFWEGEWSYEQSLLFLICELKLINHMN